MQKPACRCGKPPYQQAGLLILLIYKFCGNLCAFNQSAYCSVISIIIKEIPLIVDLVPAGVHSSESTIMYIMKEIS